MSIPDIVQGEIFEELHRMACDKKLIQVVKCPTNSKEKIFDHLSHCVNGMVCSKVAVVIFYKEVENWFKNYIQKTTVGEHTIPQKSEDICILTEHLFELMTT